jgi:hypothetical protein
VIAPEIKARRTTAYLVILRVLRNAEIGREVSPGSCFLISGDSQKQREGFHAAPAIYGPGS